MDFYWYRCPKCGTTVSTPLERAELWCIRCGKRMRQPKAPEQEVTPSVEAPLFEKDH
jgi:DNA-directed RNA polymerase subunit RPC12/RpoP